MYLKVNNGYIKANNGYLTGEADATIIDAFDYQGGDDFYPFYETSRNSFEVDSSLVAKGNTSLKKFKRPSHHRSIESQPGDGLNYYPKVGDTIYYYTAVNSNTFTYLGFFGNDEGYYQSVLDNGELQVRANYTGSGHRKLKRANYDTDRQSFYLIRLQTRYENDGIRIIMSLFDGNNEEVRLNVFDNEYFYNGRGIRWGVKGVGWFDQSYAIIGGSE